MESEQQAAFKFINKNYRVWAYPGRRVLYTGGVAPREGTIVGTYGSKLLIHLDGDHDDHVAPYHPTWELKYLDHVTQNGTINGVNARADAQKCLSRVTATPSVAKQT